MSTFTWSLLQLQAAEPARMQLAESMKQHNKAHEVRKYELALDKQHKRIFLNSAFTPTLKKQSKKIIRQGISLRILQQNVERHKSIILNIVERLALEHNVTIILHQETYCQSVRKLAFKNYMS